MAVLNIEGQKVRVDDAFLKLTPEEQEATVAEIAATLKPSKVGLTDVARSTATGVPIIGGLLNKANAATNAALAPIVEPFLEKGPETLDQPTFGERYQKSLDIQNARDVKFAKEHPVVDTAAKLAGGVGSLTGAALRVPGAASALGMTGSLPAQVAKGAASGAGIGAVDAAVRGEDVATGAGVGGAFGAGGPLVARAVGKGLQAVLPKPPATPVHEVDVGGVKIPMRPDQVTGDVPAAAEAEIVLRGGRGEPAQRVAQEFTDQQAAQVARASEEIGAGLDPAGAAGRVAPLEAGERVLDDLVAQEARRLATERGGVERTALEGDRLRATVSGQVDADGQPVRTVDSPFSAAEEVGAGVGRRRDAATARTRGLYEEVRQEPGAFDPEMVLGLSGDIRARMAQGDNPVFINPQSTGAANEAMGILDSVGGTGLFQHTAPAPPAGPLAAGARTAQSEADQAVAALVAQGVKLERAQAAVAKMTGEAAPVPRALMDPHDVAVPNGATVRVVPKVVEASEVRTSADPGYDPALQPRNRARAASSTQVNDISRNLNPNRLGLSSEADRGAPIVGPDGLVESGNGRVLAIRQAYREGGAAADNYRAWLASQGVDVSKYREPMLVRERATPMDREARKAFTIAANQSSTLSMSAAERALADAKILTPETLSLIRDPSDLASAENREFVRQFMNAVPVSERGALVTAKGELSSEGATRIRNAVLGKAYGDSPVLSRIAESTRDEVRSISNALVEAAPEWAQLRARIAAGEVPASMDVTGDLVDAVSRTARIRSKGQGLEEARAQGDAFTKQSETSETLQRLFYDADGKKAASSAQIGSALRHYAQEAAKVDAAPGLDLGLAPVTASDILKTTAQKAGAPAQLAKEVLETAAPAAAGPQIGEVGLKEIDAARKRLVELYGDAKKTALAPGGKPSDLRAMARILHEFDNAVIDAFENGRFSGDSARAAQLLKDARASHAQYRESFSSRGPGDEVGRAVEKILGRYSDSRASPDEIMRLSYGSVAEPGGGAAARVAQRLKGILGETSPEWGAYKQGLLSHVIDTPPGTAPRSASATADRIDKFLDGTQGRVLANVALSAEERAGLRSYANNLRASEPVPLSRLNDVEKIIARISGRDGSRPMTPREVTDLLYSRSGIADRGVSLRLANQLKRDLSPENWTAVRQGMWDKLVNAGEGKTPFGEQKLAQRISEFLNGDLAKTMFSASEREQMAALASVYRQMVPPKGTTNPSGTAPMLARMARSGNAHIMAMLGGVHSGFVGAAAGYGATRAAQAAMNARNARQAVGQFYGPQARRPVSSSRVPIVLSQGAAPQVANQ